MVKKTSRIFGIDWGSKYIGIADMEDDNRIPMPVWYLPNDNMFFYALSDYLVKYNVFKVIVWYPEWNEKLEEKVSKFIQNIEMLVDPAKTTVEKIDENYTSVEAGEIMSDYRKNEKTDTIAAMVILQKWIDSQK